MNVRHAIWTSFPMLLCYWVLLSLTALAPYIFFGKIIVPGADVIAYHYPAFYWYSETLRSGQSLLWSPGFLSGFPMYLSQVGGFFEPLNLFLFSIIPSFLVAYHVRIAIDFVLVMVFSYLFGRTIGISKLAAFFIGPAYLISFHWWYLSTMHFANSLFLLPFLFYIYMRARNAPSFYHRLLWAIGGGVVLGWVFLDGYAQFIVYSLTFLGIFAVLDFFFILVREQRTVLRALELMTVLGVISAVGAIVGSPQILASMAYVPISVRGGGVSYDASQYKVLGVKELIFFLFPDYLRLPFLTGGKKSLFIGLLPLLLAAYSILHFRKHRLILIFVGLFMLAFVFALPGSYLYYFLHKLPVFDLFRHPHRWLFDGIWALAVLGAIGFDMLETSIFERKARLLALFALCIATGVTVLTVAATFFGEWFWGPIKKLGFWVFTHFAYSPESFGKGLEHYEGAFGRGIDAWRDLASLTNIPFAIAYSSLLFSILLFALRVYKKVTWRQFQILGAAILALTFVGIFGARWPDSLSGDALFKSRETVGSLISEEDLALYRVHPFHPGYQFAPRHTSLIWSTEDTVAGVELQHALVVPNTNVYGGFELTDGYEPFISRDLLHVFAVLLASNYSSQDELKNVTYDDRRNLLLEHLDIVGMMAGKYIVSGMELDHPDLKLIGTPEGSRYKTLFYVYEYARALPRFYLAEKTEALPHDSVTALVNAGKKFLENTYLDCDDCAATHSAQSTLSLDVIENGHFEMTVTAATTEWLIISEQYLPGWKVTLDGEPIIPVRANGMYMGIEVPEGVHEIVAQYEGILGEAKALRYLGLFPYEILKE